MTVAQLITDVRYVLQDSDAVYFTDTELLNTFNECRRLITFDRKDKTSTVDVATLDSTYSYTTTGVISFVKAIDSNDVVRPIYTNEEYDEAVLDANGVIVTNENEIYVVTPETGVTITFTTISMPADAVTTDTIRIGDEAPYKYYMLAKSYEKDTDLEQFQKAQYFTQLFRTSYDNTKKITSSNNRTKRSVTESHFF